MNVDALIEEYIALRDVKSDLKKEWSDANAEVERRMNQIEAEFLNKFNTENSTQAKSESGIAFKHTRSSVKVQDRDTWMKHIIDTEGWHFIESKANKTAVDEYIAEHGEPPPGVAIVVETTVNVRRS